MRFVALIAGLSDTGSSLGPESAIVVARYAIPLEIPQESMANRLDMYNRTLETNAICTSQRHACLDGGISGVSH